MTTKLAIFTFVLMDLFLLIGVLYISFLIYREVKESRTVNTIKGSRAYKMAHEFICPANVAPWCIKDGKKAAEEKKEPAGKNEQMHDLVHQQKITETDSVVIGAAFATGRQDTQSKTPALGEDLSPDKDLTNVKTQEIDIAISPATSEYEQDLATINMATGEIIERGNETNYECI